MTGQVVTLDETLQDMLPALLALLDALPPDSAFLHLNPPQRRQRTLEALERVLPRESPVQPLLLVCEDLHWIDSETQELLDRLIDSLPTARLVLLVDYRPEYQHGWGGQDLLLRNCDSTRWPRRTRVRCSRRCWGTTPAWRPSHRS